ncbi:MAG TPA: hypothetical protein EYP56_13830 [Planctomycetaceae bacterium]|nr:hypothetical protein [Planctomycetaceae bacterium]
MKRSTAIIVLGLLLLNTSMPAEDDAIDIGSRRQLFVDGHLIEHMDGVRQVLHHPVRREVAIEAEYPWEKYGVSYMVTFRDGDLFRAWYRVDGVDYTKGPRRAMTAYAESEDGVHWRKPKLGIIEFGGSKENNLVWAGAAGNMAPFKDGNPAAKPDEKYKAVVRGADLFALVSPDGLHWKPAQREPILTDRPFDSHNIAFWDEAARQYVVYTRGVRREGRLGKAMVRSFAGGVRWVRRATSKDFRHWTPLKPIDTGDAPLEEFYTNATVRYERAPDYLFMFPSRFASAREPKPGWKFGKGVNDIVFLSSRDGIHFDRTFVEAFVRPGLDQGNWHERSLYMERGILQTSPNELSMYAMENWRLPSVRIRRLTLRPDGFVSVQAPYAGGELLTRPLKFSGKELRINYSTSAVGSLRVEIQDADGKVMAGFELENCAEIYGDKLDGPVVWKSGADVSSLAGRTIRLRFVMSDADVYAFRFSE